LDELVQEVDEDAVVAQRVSNYTENHPTPDAEENQRSDDLDVRVKSFFSGSCGCVNNCKTLITQEEIFDNVFSLREMTRDEKDVRIMSSFVLVSNDLTFKGGKRKRNNVTYYVKGKTVCKKTFMIYYDVGKHALQAIIKHVSRHGVTTRTHGNTGRKPIHSVTFEDVTNVVNFVRNYAGVYGLPQPAAPRGIDNLPTVFLPASNTKTDIHKEYVASCCGGRALRLTSFKDIWATCCPHIRIAKPREDVCISCERHRQAIMGAVDDEEKLEALEAMERHVQLAKTVCP